MTLLPAQQKMMARRVIVYLLGVERLGDNTHTCALRHELIVRLFELENSDHDFSSRDAPRTLRGYTPSGGKLV
jgi:hypothetical protein